MTIMTPLTSETVASPSLLSLCMRISSRKLDIMLYNPYEDQSLVYRSTVFAAQPQLVSMTPLKALESCIYDNPLLLCGEFSSTSVIIDTPSVAVFPAVISDPLPLMAETLPGLPSGAEPLLLPCPSPDATIVAMPDGRLLNFIRRTFPGATVTHPLLPFMTYVRSRLQGAGRKAFVNLHDTTLELIVISSTHLYIATRLTYSTVDDAAFYILSALSRPRCDTDEIFITGDSSDRTALTDILRRFHPYVMPLIFPSQMHRAGASAGTIPFDLLILPLTR